MSAVTGSTTLAELLVLYRANCSWEEDNDLTKAKTFVTVCTALAAMLPSQSGKGGASMSLDTRTVQEQLKRAREFIKVTGTVNGSSGYGTVIHPNFRNFRD
jgi:hypothetical protein